MKVEMDANIKAPLEKAFLMGILFSIIIGVMFHYSDNYEATPAPTTVKPNTSLFISTSTSVLFFNSGTIFF